MNERDLRRFNKEPRLRPTAYEREERARKKKIRDEEQHRAWLRARIDEWMDRRENKREPWEHTAGDFALSFMGCMESTAALTDEQTERLHRIVFPYLFDANGKRKPSVLESAADDQNRQPESEGPKE